MASAVANGQEEHIQQSIELGIITHDNPNSWASKDGDEPQLQRRLKSRHLQFIAIGSAIGTGLFIGTGNALSRSGPAGILIAFAFVGSLIYSVMVSLGEMATYMPVTGAFTVYAARFVDRSLGFSLGWIYAVSWFSTFALELTASGLIIQYWRPDLDIGIFIGCFWVLITCLNLLPVNFYGEVEFWLATIKVFTVVGFIIFGICIDVGAGQNGYLGFKTWESPGPFAPFLVEGNLPVAKFVGFWSVLITAGFSYQGTELVGLAVGECQNPGKTIPSTIKKTAFRIVFFFVGTVFIIGLLIPYDNKDLLSTATSATASPFVISAVLAGVPVLPGLINAVLLTVVLSAANSNVYSGSRILVGMVGDGCAPKVFAKTTKRGVPYVSVLFTSAFGLFGFLNESEGGTTVFNWLINISGVAGFIAWTCIVVCHLRFMKGLEAQGISRDSLPYKAAWQPWFSWYGLVFNILIILTQGFTAFLPWNTTDFFIAYISLIIFVVLYLGHKLITKSRLVPLNEMDLVTGVREIDELAVDGERGRSQTWFRRLRSSF